MPTLQTQVIALKVEGHPGFEEKETRDECRDA
jgi:hypothetical protein